MTHNNIYQWHQSMIVSARCHAHDRLRIAITVDGIRRLIRSCAISYRKGPNSHVFDPGVNNPYFSEFFVSFSHYGFLWQLKKNG
jgi:hypothetical protein